MNTDREFEIKGDLNDLSLAPYAQLVDPAFDLRRGYNTGGFPLRAKSRSQGRDELANPFVSAVHDCRAIFQRGDVDDLPVSQQANPRPGGLDRIQQPAAERGELGDASRAPVSDPVVRL